jgi:hypothetical protein
VRVWYSHDFDNKELWRNAAEFTTSKGHVAGLLMERTGEGEGKICIFFDPEVPDGLKIVFIEYVHQHLHKCAHDVQRERQYLCNNCNTPVKNREVVLQQLEDKINFIFCVRCGKKIPLIDHIEQRLGTDTVAAKVHAMDQKANQELDNQAKEQILIGHMMAICGEANQIFKPNVMFDYGIDGEVEFKYNNGKASGKKIYVQLKSGAAYLRQRKRDDKLIFDLKNDRHLEYWGSQPVDVYLVVRDADEVIRWLNMTEYLKKRKSKKSKQIVFDGELLDAKAILRLRDDLVGSM